MPYFSLGACMDGLNLLCQTLYNIELIPEEIQSGEVWDSDVYKLAGKVGSINLFHAFYYHMYTTDKGFTFASQIYSSRSQYGRKAGTCLL